MSLDVSPEIENMVRQRAAAEGVSINDLLARTFAPEKEPPVSEPIERVQQLLARWQAEDHTPIVPPMPTQSRETPTQALFRKWEEEDAHMTEEEKEAEDRLWEDIEKGIDENRGKLLLRRLS